MLGACAVAAQPVHAAADGLQQLHVPAQQPMLTAGCPQRGLAGKKTADDTPALDAGQLQVRERYCCRPWASSWSQCNLYAFEGQPPLRSCIALCCEQLMG